MLVRGVVLSIHGPGPGTFHVSAGQPFAPHKLRLQDSLCIRCKTEERVGRDGYWVYFHPPSSLLLDPASIHFTCFSSALVAGYFMNQLQREGYMHDFYSCIFVSPTF